MKTNRERKYEKRQRLRTFRPKKTKVYIILSQIFDGLLYYELHNLIFTFSDDGCGSFSV
jgi:hypothetical protein